MNKCQKAQESPEIDFLIISLYFFSWRQDLYFDYLLKIAYDLNYHNHCCKVPLTVIHKDILLMGEL